MTNLESAESTNGASAHRPRSGFQGITRWEDPPPRVSGYHNPAYKAAEEALRARPGQWAVVWEDAKSTSVANPLRDRGLQVATRSNGTTPPTWTVYARWPADGQG